MSQKLFRLLAVISVVSILLAGAAAPVSASTWRDKVDPWVLQTAAQGETEFLVYLTSQADLGAADALPTKLEKGRFVYQALSSLAQRTQAPLIAVLDQLGVQYRPYWVTNMIWVRGSLSTIQLLASRPDVANLYANPHVALVAPTVQNSPAAAPDTIEWNISWVNAPQVWALGYTGQGVVIGGQDTGYQWDHPALINHYRGWDGTTADHNYNWHDAIHGSGGNPCGYDTLAPCDDYGHGTHTMGTMVGDDGGSNQIGMAPGARWIGCRNMDQGAGTPATYTECYQFFIAPTDLQGNNPNPDLAPDVINNSWGCPPSEGCNPDSLLAPVQALVAAGIVSAHSAGNSGSGCSTVSDPAAIYDESFTVGATEDHSDTLAGFSSRGPVTVDGSGRMKPDISAPGVNIRSSVPNNRYEGGWSGTSMAGPHVAGVVALLLSARPELRGHVAEIESVIEQSAVHIASNQCSSSGVPNNLYGWGRIDALAMVQRFHMLQLNKVASAPSVEPGDLITYTLTITHVYEVSPTTNVLLTDTLPANTSFVFATPPFTQNGDTIQWGFPSLDPMESRSVNLAVRVDISATGAITNSDYSTSSDQVDLVHGAPVTTPLDELQFLQLSKVASAPVIAPGEFLTYTLTATNINDTLPVTNVILTDTVPLGAAFISASPPYTRDGDVVRWDYTSLDPLQAVSVELVVQVGLASTGSLVNASYALSSDQAGPIFGAPVTTPIQKLDFLELDKVASASLVAPGDLVTYTLTVTNANTSIAATGLVLTDTLPAGSTFVFASAPYTLQGDVIRWDFSSLPPLASQTVVLVVRAGRNVSGSLVNSDYAVYSDQMAWVSGPPVITRLLNEYFLPVTVKKP